MMQLREDIIGALVKKFEGEISAHKVNIEILFQFLEIHHIKKNY